MHEARRPRVELLSARQVELIVDEAYRTLAEVGVLVENAQALDLFAAAGARISDDSRRAFLPQDVCERCVATVPRQFALYDRDGNEAFQVGGEGVHFDPGSAATLVYDFAHKRIRKPATGDVIRFVQVTEALSAMDAQSTGIVPGDVPQDVADRYRLFLALAYGRKPVVTGTFSGGAFASMHEMLVAVRGSSAALEEKPLAVFDCCPTSPLAWSDLSSQSLIDSARSGVPVQLIPAPLLGATSPVTISGTLVQHTAENLSGIVLHQTAAPGARLVYGGAAAVMDMRHGSASMSAVEAVMTDTGCVQIGKSMGLPVQSFMGLSDAKLPDMQAGFETTLGVVMAALAGVNIASGAGILSYVNCQSLEKLVMDAEICSHALRLLGGIGIRGEMAGFDVIEECAASSAFLTSEHTRRHFREEIHYPTPVVDRISQSEWESAGAATAAERAHERVGEILASQEPALAEDDVLAALESIMSRDAVAAGAGSLPAWRK